MGRSGDSGGDPVPGGFTYEGAFARNLGWLSEAEQASVRGRRVAIAGLGGVGGIHLITLARTGVGAFSLADFDRFDLANMNRQAGAGVSTLGRPKIEVMAERALDVNPGLRLRLFPEGVGAANLDAFLAGADAYVDALDFFALDERRAVFRRCRELGIPAVTAAPLGLGAGLLVFLPGGMSFEEYFGLEGAPPGEAALRFLAGLSPRSPQRGYLVDPSRVDLAAGRGPSTGAACAMCASLAAAELLKIWLRRGPVAAAPLHTQFDAYTGRVYRTRLRRGNRGPLQRARVALLARALRGARPGSDSAPEAPSPEVAARFAPAVLRALDLARWAPSGDNGQPWRFAPAPGGVRVLVAPPDPGNPYDRHRGGEPAWLAAGALAETLRLAATGEGLRARRAASGADPGGGGWLEVAFEADPAIARDPLVPWIPLRSVDRRPHRARPLAPAHRRALEAALDSPGDSPGGARRPLEIRWFESPAERWRMARLNARAAAVRLRMPEARPAHRAMVDWARDYSPDRMPRRALGLWRPTLAAMRWALEGARSERRSDLLARLPGTGGVALQADLIPGLFCSAHFALRLPPEAAALPPGSPGRREALLEAGAALARFWLTATALGLALQPSMAALIFAEAASGAAPPSRHPGAARRASGLARAFEDLLGSTGPWVFAGRIGSPRGEPPRARSVREPLARLLVPPPDAGSPPAATGSSESLRAAQFA